MPVHGYPRARLRPRKTPKQKRDRILYHGGDWIELIVGGKTYDLAAEAALDDVARTGATLVPPYNDPAPWPGRARSRSRSSISSMVSPIRWSCPSAAAGASAVSRAISPNAQTRRRCWGGACRSRIADGRPGRGEPVTLDEVDQFVDGAAVARIGAVPFEALAAAGDMVSVTTVDEGAVCTAMLDLYQNEGIIAEPAGALSVAGLLEADVEPGSTVVCLISGGNNDVSRYGEVLERSLVHLGLKHYFLVDFPRSLARCAASSTRCSARMTTSRCSSTSSATTARRVRPWSASNSAQPPTSRACWIGCPIRSAISSCSSRVHPPTAT